MHLDRCHISRLYIAQGSLVPGEHQAFKTNPRQQRRRLSMWSGQIQEVHWKNSAVLGIFPVFDLLSIVVTYYFLRHQTSPERFDIRAIQLVSQLVFCRQTIFFLFDSIGVVQTGWVRSSLESKTQCPLRWCLFSSITGEYAHSTSLTTAGRVPAKTVQNVWARLPLPNKRTSGTKHTVACQSLQHSLPVVSRADCIYLWTLYDNSSRTDSTRSASPSTNDRTWRVRRTTTPLPTSSSHSTCSRLAHKFSTKRALLLQRVAPQQAVHHHLHRQEVLLVDQK